MLHLEIWIWAFSCPITRFKATINIFRSSYIWIYGSTIIRIHFKLWYDFSIYSRILYVLSTGFTWVLYMYQLEQIELKKKKQCYILLKLFLGLYLQKVMRFFPPFFQLQCNILVGILHISFLIKPAKQVKYFTKNTRTSASYVNSLQPFDLFCSCFLFVCLFYCLIHSYPLTGMQGGSLFFTLILFCFVLCGKISRLFFHLEDNLLYKSLWSRMKMKWSYYKDSTHLI